MTGKRPATIQAYIDAAPGVAQPYLRRMHLILRDVAPDAEEAIKWGTPFFIEPRFLFAFSAFKSHLSFAPTAAAIEHFGDELKAFDTTQQYLRLPYDQPLPEALIRKIARYRLKTVAARTDDGFW